MPEPIDYFSHIAPVDPNAFMAGFNATRAPAQAQRADQIQALQIQAAQQQAQEALHYQSDVQSVVQHPSADGFRNLILRYPRQHEGLKAAWDQYSDGEQRRNTEAAASVYAAIAAGKPDIALTTLKQRQQALKGAGQDTTETDALIGLLESGDPKQIARAKGVAGMVLAVSTGPDKIGSTLDALSKGSGGYTLSPGQHRFDDENNDVASVADKPDYLVVPEGGSAVPLNDAARALGGVAPGGGGAGRAAAGGSLDPHAFFKEFVAPHEGGYAAHDANGAAVNHGINQSANPGVDVKNLSADDAADIFATKYFNQSGAASLPPALAAVHADTYFINPKRAEGFLQQSGGDPAKYMALRRSWMASLVARDPEKYGKYEKAWTNRNRDLQAYSAQLGGGAPAASAARPGDPAGTIYGRTKPVARTLTSSEAQAKGLDPKKVYEQRPDGTVSAVGDAVAGADSLPGNPNLNGPAYLATVPKNLADQARALAEGRLPFPSSFALSKPYWQKLIQITTQYDPTFDAARAKMRQQAAVQFTGNGKAAQTVGSVNRVANHLKTLWDASENLVGPSLGWGPLNSVVAATGQRFQPNELKAFNSALPLVSDELEKIARGGTGTLHGVEQIMANLSPSESLETRRQAIKTAIELVHGAIDPLRTQYNSAFEGASSRPPIPWISPRARKIYEDIAGIDFTLDGGGGASSAGHASLPAGAKQVGTYQGKPVFQLPSGKRVVQQ